MRKYTNSFEDTGKHLVQYFLRHFYAKTRIYAKIDSAFIAKNMGMTKSRLRNSYDQVFTRIVKSYSKDLILLPCLHFVNREKVLISWECQLEKKYPILFKNWIQFSYQMKHNQSFSWFFTCDIFCLSDISRLVSKFCRFIVSTILYVS